jgi:hypothetical protein
MNPFLKRLAKQGQTGHGNISEKRVAKQLGAQQTPGSGAFRGHKGDARLKTESRKFLIESKATKAATMSLDLGWLVKIATEAKNTGATPVLTVSFVNPDGTAKPNGDWIMMPSRDFKEEFAA